MFSLLTLLSAACFVFTTKSAITIYPEDKGVKAQKGALIGYTVQGQQQYFGSGQGGMSSSNVRIAVGMMVSSPQKAW